MDTDYTPRLCLLSNAMCNNILFTKDTIHSMHESMEKLYKIARAREGIHRQSEMAQALNESQQTVNNWEARGISMAGALKAQQRFGVDANWVLANSPPNATAALSAREEPPIYGAKQMQLQWQWPFKDVNPDDFRKLTDQEKEHIERDILLRVEGRETKQNMPGSNEKHVPQRAA